MPRQEPERTCIVTREAKAPAGLIRFVLGPDNQVVADLKHKLPGRGAWVTGRADVVEQAVKRRLFSRAFKTEAKTASTLAQDIDAALAADLRQSLALANKAGAVVTGFTKVEAAIAAEKPIAALVHAAKAAEDGRRKLAGALRKRFGDAISHVPVVDVLSGAELDLALGRAHVIHAALVAGAGSDGFLMRWHRLRAYRGATGADHAGYPSGAGEPDDHEPAGPETLND
jgi:predicted RNA-binding protein YlxR (DUF448 family)